MRVEAPSFDGRLDPTAFFDWVIDMDHSFEWYGMSKNRQMWFAKMKLVGQAKRFWATVEHKNERSRAPPIVHWVEMKEVLKEKYLPFSYRL
ncbi:hypothetical protein PJP07_30150, partial [Mycobacterium kansasii]